MSVRAVLVSAVAALALASYAADAPPAEEKKLTPKEALKARMRAEGKKQPAPATTSGATTPATAATTTPATATKDGADAKKKSAKSEPPAPPPTVMPQVDVRGSRITELDQQVAKQEREIAHEKENTKPTEMDRALNDPKLSKILSIFGGESSQHRAGIAQERVSLMEAEKDILEAMKTARTKEEKVELQKQLDELKAFRRELEKSLR